MSDQPKIYLASHRSMVGSAICRTLKAQGNTYLVTLTHAELDLNNKPAVQQFFAKKPTQFYLAAARVGVFMPTSDTQGTSPIKT